MADKRREKGTGGITQRKDGYWVGRYDAGTKPNGKRDVRVVYGKTEPEAKRKLKDLIKELNKTEYTYVQRSSVKDYMMDWLTQTKRNELKPKSYDRLEQTLEKDVFPYIGHLQLQAISTRDVQMMINNLRDSGRSYSSIKKAYEAVNACFKHGLVQNTVSANPAAGVSIPSQKLFRKKQIPYYTQEEANKIVTQALSVWSNGVRRYPLGDFVPLILNTGLRLGEILALQWERDVDFETKTITVHSNIVTVKDRSGDGKTKYHTVEQDEVKTDAGQDRVIPLNNAALNALRALQEVTGKETYVLTTRNKTQVKQRQLDQMFRRIVTAAGMPEEKIYGVHALRHTFATLLIYNHVDIKTVSKLMGHSDVGVTYNTYVHVIKEAEKSAVASIPDIVYPNQEGNS